MNIYEELQQEAHENNIIVKEVSLKSSSDGLYYDGKIAINKTRLTTNKEKACVLAEELAHHYKSYGNILDIDDMSNAKQEYKARLFSYDKLIGLNGIINAWKNYCRTKEEIADYLNVTIPFLDEAIECYKKKYDPSVQIDNYAISFSPSLIITELIDIF
ncbi:gp23-like protein [[Clostridium] sordellii]|uniref:ImmA/IrrE family metallo-endopeptidase n=1 Tax=Paraclostridium sordellii TaxID=1505 RepID=UPI0005E1414F|nr:ImmA/IrrE family metallo-endopeptidase [Paeniclostridium sordellii]MDU6247327.1 ImmA/IrrE family metallo-endopeptidase [Paeniclostridium sordellii]MRZ79691.1 ImmA/IrrE family metallo-endopeptidase [Paeniclostridium sordellii]MSB57701.1 ImmA/IrrE family metallo-endopeptidase [Paeniclostridium sordellii]MVO70935.1 ImmA/IrrE family metallo-endopeptidase [Paeniclostridium sordellii]CEN89531.1 gp23-like protein [[Clostridium] sordellii] [Paeniclostridium sordellii]